jgi:hypothetical protein
MRWLTNLLHRKPQRATTMPIRRARLELEALEARTMPALLITPQWAPVDVHNGGGELNSTPIYLIFAGDYWNGAAGQKLEVEIAIAAATFIQPHSYYLDSLKEYHTDGNAWIAGVTQRDLDFGSPATTSDHQLKDLLSSLTGDPNSGVPGPGGGVTPLYVFITPPDVTEDGASGDHTSVGMSEPFAWVGTNPQAAGTANALDAATVNLSHEVAEAITDPWGFQNGTGVYVTPNPNDPDAGDDSEHEICDYEAGVYYFRVDGVLIQGYYSAFYGLDVIPTDTLQDLSLTPHWDRNNNFRDFSVTVNGDQLYLSGRLNDVITLDTTPDPTGTGTDVDITLNSEHFTFEPGKVIDVTVNALQGNDTINVERTVGKEMVHLNTGDGLDTVNISPVAHNWGNIGNTVNITGDFFTTINVYDQADSRQQNYTLGTFLTPIEASVHPDGVNWLDYTLVENVVVHGSDKGATWTVNGGTIFTSLTLDGGNGNDTFNLGNSRAALPSLYAKLAIDGGKGLNTFRFDDSANHFPSSVTYTLTAGGLTRTGNAPNASLTIALADLADLYLTGAASASMFAVQGIAGDTFVEITTSRAGSTVDVGDAKNTWANIDDDLLVVGGGSINDRLILNDQGTADTTNIRNNLLYTLSNGAVSRSDTVQLHVGSIWEQFKPIIRNVTYVGIRSMTVNGSTTDKNSFLVQQVEAGAPVTLNGGNAADTFSLGDDNYNLEYFNDTLTLNGGGGDDSVTVKDAADVEGAAAPQVSYYLSNQSRQPNGQVLSRIDLAEPNLPSADIEFGGVEHFTLNASPYGNDINIDSTRAATPVTVYTGIGTNTVNLGLAAGRVSPLAGLVKVYGQGNDTLLISDNATLPGQQYVVAADHVGWASASATTVPTHVRYDGLTRLELDGAERGNVITVSGTAAGTATVVKAGLGKDTVKITGTAPAFAGPLSIDGQGGVNTLDYSGFRGPVTVNLPRGTATAATGGVTNIRNVTGGSGDDLFVGDGTGNVLKGGTGRNFLIAGAAPGTLTGQGGEDVLVGGSTSYDTNPTALAALMAEWTANAPYQTRVTNLLQGGQGGAPALNGTAGFTNNGGGNTLTGAAGLDLFYGIKASDANDWNGGIGEVFVENNTPVSIKIDAHALSLPTLLLDGSTVVNTQTVESFSVLPGYHTLAENGYTYFNAAPVTFRVLADGTVTYDKPSAGVLGGQNTNTLVVNGATVTIDARALSTPRITVDVTYVGETASPFTITVLPGPQEFFDTWATGNVIPFKVTANGTVDTVDYDPSQSGLLSGQGTSTLVVNGRTITIEARALSSKLLTMDVSRAYSTSSPITLNVLPGPQSLWDYYGSGETIRFAVSDTGAITFDSGFDGVLSAQGSTLTVTGETVTIDPRQLSLYALVVDTIIVEPMTSVFTLNLLPGDHWLTDNYGWSGPVHFQVNPDGTVSYASSLDGVFTGNGTAASPLLLEGVTLQIDATAISSQVAYYAVATAGGLSTAQVQTLHVLPGTFQLTAGSEQLVFSLTAQPDGSYGLSYDSSLDGMLTGRGTRRLTLLA